MNEWDVLFRAFHEYKKKTSEEKNIKRLSDAILNAPTDNDNLEAVRTYCVIEEDWIKIIEEGMVYVEKAIREERQFIRKQGEVVPIEKLKHVSTDTVTHLARHSELITREPEEDEPLTPEKLYMVENLSDFSVYENRFLYMLLCYTRDFISIRLDKIIEFGKTFNMKAKTVKRVKVGKKTLYYTSALEYEDKNDPLSKSFSASVDLIERIENMQRLTVSLLATPLMKEVSKTPMIKPPITRTNVLRMNNNFKNALEMYCKLAEYNKDGYTIEKIKNTMRPFADALMSEQTQLILLQQFLYYKYGNKLSEKLWNEYLAEEERQKIKEKETLKLQIEKIKKKIEETGKGYEEYFLLMEKQMVEFDSALKELGLTKAKVDNLNAVVSDMQKQIDVQTANNVSLRGKLQEKETELVQTISRHQEELVKLNNEHEKAIVQLNEEHAKNVSEIEEKHSKEKTEEKNKHQEDCATLNKQIEEEKNLKTIFKGQLHGLRNQYGLMTDEEDFTSKEKFNELEEEFLALEKLLKSQWKETKKKIRIEIWKKK